MIKESLLLLHGALGSKQQLQELKRLLQEDFNVIDLDFEGHGGRTSNKDFSIDLFVHNVEGKLKDLKLTQTNIFGYSMGGYVALQLAAKQPELVQKIMTLGTKFSWNEEISAQEIRKLNPEKIEEKVPSFANYLRELHHPEDWKSVVRKTARLMEDLCRGQKLSNIDLQKIEHQVQIGIGELDNMVSLDESKKAVEQLSNGSLLVLEGIKHPIEGIRMKSLAEIITDFIQKS